MRRLEIVSDLQQAISGGELRLQYQPIVDLETSRVIGAEALVRWWRGGEMVAPRDFLSAAEESGLIVPLGEWVLREACAQGAAWRRLRRTSGSRSTCPPGRSPRPGSPLRWPESSPTPACRPRRLRSR